MTRVWVVEGRTSRLTFASEELALAYLSSFPPSVSGGLAIFDIEVIGGTPAPEATAIEAVRHLKAILSSKTTMEELTASQAAAAYLERVEPQSSEQPK